MSRAAEGTAPELPRQANDRPPAREPRASVAREAGALRGEPRRAPACLLREAWAGRLGPIGLVCASAVGWYGGDHGDAELDESAPAGAGFLAELCRDWETAAARVEPYGVRRVSLRFGVVLAREGGALALMLRPFRLGLGGRLGSGRQWTPWVHVDDVVGLILLALDADAAAGPMNAVAPEPVRNRELTRLLAAKLGRPAFLPVPAFALRAALGEIAGELLDSRRVAPRRAQALGYRFVHATLASALDAELRSGEVA